VIKTTIESPSNSGPANSGSRRVGYPFAAVVGHRTVKQALLLLAIEPRLKGALIASESGSAKSTLAQAFGSLLPTLAEDCGRSQADPSDPELGAEAVELPLNITVDRLLGGLDLERTIATGRRELATGLLAQANGRALYVNDINLLDSSTATHVAHALDSRQVHIEREGLSAIQDADFMFVGTFNSGEGEPSSLLRDRVGLIVDSRTECSADEKAEIIDRAIRFDTDPFSFADDFAFETAELKSAIEAARERLPRVRVSKNHARQISQIAIRLGVEGNRADVFALKAARASAALARRIAVTEDDVVVAIQLVLAPRATRLPSPSEETKEQAPDLEEDNHEAGDGNRDSIPGAIEDAIIQAIDACVPKDLVSLAPRTPRPSRTGKRFKASTSIRGRYVRSVMNRTRDARVALDATLRAAAPFQLSRQAQDELNRKQSSGAEALKVAMTPARRVKIDPGDLRFKEFKKRSGILFIFAVDASGSMALNRMAQAKGALTRLLQQAYLHRDKVALISFRGERADVLLAPTRSVELAKRLIDALPAGGGTPLSAGVVKAIELGPLARLRGTSRAMLVLFTEGRANVGVIEQRTIRTASTIVEELRRLGAVLGSEEISTVVVDTKSRFVSSGEGDALARMLGARYFYLPRADAGAVYDAIASTARGQREQTDG